ncbi:NHPM bacteriocin system ABC transporter, ATP-binding protein [Artemisia annua]|uniref:NHPM bacteriocin system ABC transporter, ATP-binding protein n=1 Tax=Artemisia annua TaxID=35608 RepID=A0A2U1NKG4_ARTAN|nr:NHPM bacteriocin system ABC transporter, ATP-binding protein [Artemisia annua]
MEKLDHETIETTESLSKPEIDEKEKGKPGLTWMLFQHADWKDIVLMALGTTGCFVDGLSVSVMMLVLSHLMNSYASLTSLTLADVNRYALAFIYIALVVGAGAFLEGFCWGRTAERQTSRIRTKYLKAILRQQVGYFDTTLEASRVTTSISSDTLNIQGVLSEKIPNFITNIWMFIAAEITGLYICWRLAIVAVPAMFLLILPGSVYGMRLARNEEKLQEAYVVAGGIAEQALSSIKTVHSYVAEEKMVKRFSTALEPTLTLGIKQGKLKGMVFGSVGIIYAIWALLSWYGSILVIDKGIKGGDILSAGVCVIYGGFGLGSSFMNIKYFAEASISSAVISEMIDRIPTIDSEDEQGTTISAVKGNLEFMDIDFAYPSRPESLVLKKFNLNIKACQTVGLVGQSGSGKSTVINLLERFYNPLKGEILLDGISIESLRLNWLRRQMGLVSQEPILFATTIRENILFGKEDATSEEIVEAAKRANAHNFIAQLPKGYETLVGELGTQMSGGQKQRISIARALLREPKILLLDEATSSLDSHSEKAVQEALTQASVGRTTIIVAHRLSTLRDADLIVVIQSGEVIESGSHDQLIKNTAGPYSVMVQLQKALVVDGQSLLPTELTESKTLIDDVAITTEKTELIVTGSRHEEQSNQSAEKEDSRPSWRHLIEMNRPEWKSALMGCIGALLNGLIQPTLAFAQGAMLSMFFLKDHNEIRSQTRALCYTFVAIAASAFIVSVVQHYYFGIMGENLTKRVREIIFAKIMTFEIEWFDQENNSTGALCSRLATDTIMVRNLVADRLAFFAQTISASISAVILSMILSWRLALVAITVQLIIIVSFYLKSLITTNPHNKSSEIASEAVSNHRIITAYHSQKQVMRLFEDTQETPKTESNKQHWYSGVALFARPFLTNINIAILYWYGGKLLCQGDITYKHLFQTFYIVVSAGMIIAETGSMTGDLSLGKNALKSLFMILKIKSKMGILKQDAKSSIKIDGRIQLKEVDFFYLSRPTKMALNGLSLKIDAGEIVALVGTSGSGKSTIIGLIQRFYDPCKGSVEVDGIDINCYDLRALRSCIAWVSQEPTLFAETIKENIAYGKENATEAEIIQAASLANIHEFISSMKDGYDTYCGERGVQLSGGQKQRIVIARAILKNPAILLLDEATSALDLRSEALVQDALEKTMVGRTCIIVAHRLSTIQRSNRISVIDNGRVIEEGSHDELLAKGEEGAYFSLFSLQQTSFHK